MPVNKFGDRGEDEQAETSGLSLSFVNSKFVDTQELKNELNKYLTVSGSINDLNMNSRRITNVADPVDLSDVMTKRYFENNTLSKEDAANKEYVDAALRRLAQTLNYAKVWPFQYSGSQTDKADSIEKEAIIVDDGFALIEPEQVFVSAYCDPRQIPGVDLKASVSVLWQFENRPAVRIQVGSEYKRPWTGRFKVFVRVEVFPQP